MAKKVTTYETGLDKFNRVSPGVNVIVTIGVVLLAITCIVPLLLVLGVSVSSEDSIMRNGYQFIPEEFSMVAYKAIFSAGGGILRSLGVSVFLTIAGLLTGLALNTTMAYSLSRPNFRFKRFFTIWILIPMLFSGGMLPFYIIVAQVLNLRDSLWSIILVMAVSSYNIIILRTFFKNTIPDSIVESAEIDGANQLLIFTRIVLPLSLPVLATIGLMLAFGYWNDWYNARLFISNSSLWPLQLLLMNIQDNIEWLRQNMNQLGAGAIGSIDIPSESVRMAIVIVIVLPIASIYPFFQRYFISGLTIGAVKG